MELAPRNGEEGLLCGLAAALADFSASEAMPERLFGFSQGPKCVTQSEVYLDDKGAGAKDVMLLDACFRYRSCFAEACQM